MDLSKLGKLVNQEERVKIFEKLNELLELSNNVNNPKFLGCHPTTLTLDNIPYLLSKDYMVCEKTDGVRTFFILLAEDNGTRAFFYDRKNDFYEIKIKFSDIKNSIFDGELFYEDNTILTYALFDCLVFRDENVTGKNLLKRLFYCQEFVKLYKENKEEIQIYVKDMYKSYGFIEIYRQLNTLKHDNDGLIFTPVEEGYVFYKRGGILKWKPPSINTVDFKVKQIESKENVYSLICRYKTNEELVVDYFIGEVKEDDINDKIVEFAWDEEGLYVDYENLRIKKGGWKFYKVRKDKDLPNHFKVVNSIMTSLEEKLDMEELSRYYKPMRSNWKYREMKNKTKNDTL